MRGHSLLEALESPWSPCEVMDSHKFRGKDLRVPRSRSFSGNWNSSKISSASYEDRKEEVCQLILDMHVQSVKWSCASRLDLSNTIHWRVLEFFFTFHEALREKKNWFLDRAILSRPNEPLIMKFHLDLSGLRILFFYHNQKLAPGGTEAFEQLSNQRVNLVNWQTDCWKLVTFSCCFNTY